MDLLVDLPVPTMDADVAETGYSQGEVVEEVEAEKRGAGEDREASLAEGREEDLEEEGVVVGGSREKPSSSTAQIFIMRLLNFLFKFLLNALVKLMQKLEGPESPWSLLSDPTASQFNMVVAQK